MARSSPARQASLTRDPDELAELGRHRFATVRLAVATNDATPDAVLAWLIDDADAGVRSNAARAATDRPSLHEAMSVAEDRWVRAILAHAYAGSPGQGLTRAIQERLAEDPFHEVRGRVAETTSHRDLFDRLLADPEPRVRVGAASNPRLTRADAELLLADRIAAVRAGMIAGGVVYPDDEQLVRMASDPSVEVRWQVLIRPEPPRAALEILVRDPDQIVRDQAARATTGAVHTRGAVASFTAWNDRLRGFAFGDEVVVGLPAHAGQAAPTPPLDQHLVLLEIEGVGTIAHGPDQVFRVFGDDGSARVLSAAELEELVGRTGD